MTYQDYLPDTPYEALPAAIRAEIARAEYETLQDVTASMAASLQLSPALRTAFRARTAPETVVYSKSTSWRITAVLGWGLLVLSVGWQLRQTPERVVEYQESPPLPAEVVVRYDTVRIEVVKRVERVHTVRDTVYVDRIAPPVVRIDTAHPPLRTPPGIRSRSVADGPDWRALTVGGSILSESD